MTKKENFNDDETQEVPRDPYNNGKDYNQILGNNTEVRCNVYIKVGRSCIWCELYLHSNSNTEQSSKLWYH